MRQRIDPGYQELNAFIKTEDISSSDIERAYVVALGRKPNRDEDPDSLPEKVRKLAELMNQKTDMGLPITTLPKLVERQRHLETATDRLESFLIGFSPNEQRVLRSIVDDCREGTLRFIHRDPENYTTEFELAWSEQASPAEIADELCRILGEREEMSIEIEFEE